ncbi:MAG: hypothetical protein WBP29_11935 [Candidatus Zixiibacteriota bacterium]
MSWSLYLLVAVILVGCVLTVALFGGMVWLARRKDNSKPNV